MPFTSYTYNGFANSIPLGLDLSGGISAVYNCSLSKESGTEDLSSAIDATITRLQEMLYDEGFSEATITRQGGSKIRIEVPNLSDSQDLFNLIGTPASLYITTDEDFDVKNPSGEYVSGKDITSVYDFIYSGTDSELNGQYVVSLNFNDAGAVDFKNVTTTAVNGDKKIYIFIGDEDPMEVGCETVIANGSTIIHGGSINDKDSAEAYALRIMSGTFSATLDMVECTVVSATLGKDALLYGIIAGGIAVLLVMLIMWWRYGRMGLLADYALVIYMILMLFFLQAIPFVQLTLPGIAGIILSLGMAVDGNVIIFERIREDINRAAARHTA